MSASAVAAGPVADRRFAAGALSVVLLAVLASGVAPRAGHLNWFLEVFPGVIGVAVLVALRNRFPMSNWVYGAVALHVCVLAYGGYYTYAQTPLGNWARDAFGLARNHYDRIGHLALGVFPAFIIKEVLLRRTPLRRGGWLTFLILSVVLAIGAFWELLEWWATLIFAADVGHAFLGSQGDVWDAQWDMFLALVGAALALALATKAHDRSMQRLGV